jgi:hypothetical protein
MGCGFLSLYGRDHKQLNALINQYHPDIEIRHKNKRVKPLIDFKIVVLLKYCVYRFDRCCKICN